MRAALALSEELVDELLSTDLLVIGVPMYNFGIPAALKAYIDQIVRIGRTFAFEPHDTAQPYKPLVRGKQAIVIVSSGDAGSGQGEPLATLNQVEPYLRTVLGYIGILQIDFIYAGNDEFGGDRLDQSLNYKHLVIDGQLDGDRRQRRTSGRLRYTLFVSQVQIDQLIAMQPVNCQDD